VVLPADYAAGQRRYAVLYLLHGWQGDETNWITLTHLVEAAARYPLIVVTPRAGNSWYVNSAVHPADRYGDLLTDIIADVDSHFRTIADAHERAVAGLSMGGYGAMLYALRHPGVFAFAGSVSGAFAGLTNLDKLLPQLQPSLDEAYGTADSPTRKENDLDSWIATADPASTPYLFLECGTADPLLPLSRHTVAELSAQKLAYEYHELPGAHTWTFWDNSLTPMLDAVAAHLHLLPLPDSAPSLKPLHR
jgi:S-formylglutathione hydrolase FrmB